MNSLELEHSSYDVGGQRVVQWHDVCVVLDGKDTEIAALEEKNKQLQNHFGRVYNDLRAERHRLEGLRKKASPPLHYLKGRGGHYSEMAIEALDLLENPAAPIDTEAEARGLETLKRMLDSVKRNHVVDRAIVERGF